MQPSIPMKHLFILLRGSEIICDIIYVAGTVWTILSVFYKRVTADSLSGIVRLSAAVDERRRPTML